MCRLQVTLCALAFTLGTAAAQTTFTTFGDSITDGSDASDTVHRYVNLIAGVEGWTLVDKAVSWSQAADQADAIYGTAVVASNPYLYMIGTNDVRIYGPDPVLESVFHDEHLAEAAWLAIPAAAKITGLSPRVSFSGSWFPTPGVGPVGYGIGQSSYSQGDTAKFTVSGGTIFIGVIVSDGSGGEFSLTVDGVLQGTYRCYASSPVLTHLGRTFAPKGIRIAGLSNGDHEVVLTVTSPTLPQNRVYFDWAAGVHPFTALPRVYLGNVPRFGSDSFFGHTAWEYSTIVAANARLLKADGLDIRYVDAAAYMDQQADLTADAVHPNDAGHRHLAQAYIDAIDQAPPAAETPQVAWAGILNAFTSAYTTLAPGEIVTVYGSSLGPVGGVTASFDPVTGLLPDSLGGTSVLIGGSSAPLLYADQNQIDIQIPYELSGRTTSDLIITRNGVPTTMRVALGALAPGLAAVVLNEDGTLNKPDNPAAPGSVIVLFGTGQGVTTPATKTGSYPQAQIYPTPLAPFDVQLGGVSADLYFDGDAPFTAGVIQLSVRVPDSADGSVPVTWTVNAIPAPQNVTVYVAQPARPPS